MAEMFMIVLKWRQHMNWRLSARACGELAFLRLNAVMLQYRSAS